MNYLKIKEKSYKLPMFLPDGTMGVTRGLDSIDVKKAGIKGLVVNTYHLAGEPGVKNLKVIGGIKKLMNFKGLIVSDSGGWQVFSLIHRRNQKGKITDKGIKFSIGKAKNEIFTPEKSIKIQFAIGADIIICLDDFSSPKATKKELLESVERTILWAKRSKKEYEKIIKKQKIIKAQKPLFFSVIQGGFDRKLRKYCANELQKIGFDGYGFGGYVVNKDKVVDKDIAKYIADLIPNDKYKFALGMGKLFEIPVLFEMGWEIFDCTLPTRDARHKRIYIINKIPENYNDLKNPDNYSYLYINRTKYRTDNSPISESCDCYTCNNYNRSYLYHLFKINDILAYRLATIHNLRCYSRVIGYIKKLDKKEKIIIEK